MCCLHRHRCGMVYWGQSHVEVVSFTFSVCPLICCSPLCPGHHHFGDSLYYPVKVSVCPNTLLMTSYPQNYWHSSATAVLNTCLCPIREHEGGGMSSQPGNRRLSDTFPDNINLLLKLMYWHLVNPCWSRCDICALFCVFLSQEHQPATSDGWRTRWGCWRTKTWSCCHR